MPGTWTRRELCIRAAGVVMAGIAAPFVGVGSGTDPRGAHAASENASRAAQAYTAMQRRLYVERDQLYREYYPHPARRR